MVLTSKEDDPMSDSEEKNEALLRRFVDGIGRCASGYVSAGTAECWSLGIQPHTTSNDPIDA
jgi:hypothetical protein